MSEKHKKVCRTLNYFDPFLVFVSAVSKHVSISAFSHQLVYSVPVGIMRSALGLKISAITAESC